MNSEERPQSSHQAQPERRRQKLVRFKPQKGVYAFVEKNPRGDTKKFSPSLAGLVLNQSFKGCAIVLQQETAPAVGTKIKVKLGPLHPIIAEVRWASPLDKELFKIGLLFCE